MPTLFGVTMFVSATLLFLVQPMVGKMTLPLLGGTPAVWNTCMVFFQALLLLGYFYAHKTTELLAPRKQVNVHVAVFTFAIVGLIAGAVLSENSTPIPIVKSLAPQGSEIPFFGIIMVLGIAIGVPFFVVSTTAPLLQKWFSETGHPSAKDPYFLYAASNAGSLLSLIAYPVVVEPNLTLIQQAIAWSIGFVILAIMIIRCGSVVKTTAPVEHVKSAASAIRDVNAPSWMTRLRWLILAAVPSSLMLSLTTEITTDIVSIPLIWIVPLALYLITFIIVFSKMYVPIIHLSVSLITPVIILLVVFMHNAQNIPGTYSGPSYRTVLLIQMLMYFMITMTCHGELARIRPSTRYLTNFYLTMSLGGMLGGLFNALVAPVAFTFISEYPLSLIAACMVLPKLSELTKTKESVLKPASDLGMFTLYFLLFISLRIMKLSVRVLFNSEDFEDHSIWYLALSVLGILAVSYVIAFVVGKRFRKWASILWTVVIALVFFNLSCFMSLYFKQIVNASNSVILFLNLTLNSRTVATIVAFGLPTLATYFLVERPVRFGASVAALFAGVFVTFLWIENKNEDYRTVHERSFFGTLKIEYEDTELADKGFIKLIHGTTLHGKQRRLVVSELEKLLPMGSEDPWSNLVATAYAEKQWTKPGREPLTYYHPTGPVGYMFREFESKLKSTPGMNSDVACIGLGTGSLSSYGMPGQKMTFFEIDNHVRRLVEPPTYFTYLDQAKKQKVDLEFLMGDARLTLEKLPAERKWGFMLVDAFSSDSIPAHMLTKQSVELYFMHLEKNGVCALHISNRYLHLEPVVEKIVKELGLSARVMHDQATSFEEDELGKTSSSWIAVARDEASLGQLVNDPKWVNLVAVDKVDIWTDDFTPIKNILMGQWDIMGAIFGK